MSVKGVTTTMAVVLAIVTLIVGLGIGIAISPAVMPPPAPGPDWVPKEDYDAVVAERDSWRAKYEEVAGKGLSGEVLIGFLGSMSGDLASYGENEATAAQLAVKEVNELLQKIGAGWSLKLVIEDTETKPEVCLEKVESLNAKGIKLVIGPLSSGELSNIMSYVNSEKILTTSQSSTAPELGFPDDYVFRFCPNDRWQGRAMARVMWEMGIRYVIPTWRGDAWGDGLEAKGKERFEELGGTFLEGVRYSVPRSDFSVEAATLKDLVADAVAKYGADKVGVWLIAFEEATAYFKEALQYDELRQVKWFGSDGTVNTPGLIDPSDPEVSKFVTDVNFINPIFSPLPGTWKYDKVRSHILEKLGREPDSYSYTVYDIVWAYAYSLMVVDRYDPEAIKEILPDVTKSLYGATGWVSLDENGDRAPTNYDLWKVQEVEPGVYDWVRVGRWILETDSVEWF